MPLTNDLYLLTGSNIEPRFSYLSNASQLIEKNVGPIWSRSSIYESAPWGFEAETSFFNQVLHVKSDLHADDILQRILAIESEMGRLRNDDGYSSRIIDIDILYYGQLVLAYDQLTIPHPRMHLRRFTMLPLVELSRDFFHPKLNKTNEELLTECPDQHSVSIVNLD
jgi:2-amino-4-hydroxy-6-hydroxymethyldihydropteridine diphosphokinase